MFWPKKDNTAYDDIAKVVVSDFVYNMSLDNDWDDGYQNKDAFLKKCILYRTAIVLMVLLSAEKKINKLKNLRTEFEKIAFGEQNEKSINFLNEVRSAMKDLGELLFADSPKQMTWAMNWLLSVGIDEINPVKLSLVALKWMDSYIVFVKTSRDILK